jgi:hypothetical protein
VLLQFYHKEILKIAEELYDRFLKAAVNNTIYLLTSTLSMSLKKISESE